MFAAVHRSTPDGTTIPGIDVRPAVGRHLVVVSYDQRLVSVPVPCENGSTETTVRPPSATVVSAEPFSHGTGTLRCLQKEMATYRH